tara:strand:- start:6693 stop:7379 length:687 start_codon:yes stop_codon:yes gene_type:complete
MNKQPQPNYDFLDNSISKPTTKPTKPVKSKQTKPPKKSPTKPKVKPSMTQAPPNMKQSKPPPPVKSKPKVIAVVKKTKQTPTDKPVSPKQPLPTQPNKFKQSQKQLNSENIDKNNKSLFSEIVSNQEEMNVKPLNINQYSKIVNNIKTLLNKTDYLITEADLPTLLIKQSPLIMKTIADKYKLNTQRSIIGNIITILTYSNNDIKVKDLKSYELFRKSQILKNKQTNL